MDKDDVRELIKLLERALNGEMGPMFFMSKEEMVRRGLGGGKHCAMSIGDFIIFNERKRKELDANPYEVTEISGGGFGAPWVPPPL